MQPQHFPALPPGWISEWSTFASSDDQLQLYSVLHHSEENWTNPRTLVVLHGLGEHGGRYLHVPHYVQSAVGAVYCLDHRGHGRSEGIRGHVDRFDLYVDDAVLAIQRLDESLKKRFGQSEIHLLAHSMGGLIGLRTLLHPADLPLASASISAPLLGLEIQAPWLKRWLGVALSQIWGSVHLSTEFDARVLSHDPAVVAAYQADRLVHGKVTPRFYTEMQAAMADTRQRESGIRVPIQLLIPLQDRVVSAEAALQFYRSLKHRDKRLKTYADFYHEPLNELGKETVFEDLVTWIQQHSKAV